MTDDDDRPDNVIPFPDVIPYALSRELRRYFQSLVDEPLPKEIEALSQEFAKLAEGAAEPDKVTKADGQKDSEQKDTQEKV